MLVEVELLYLEGCPSYEAFLPRLRVLLSQAEVDVAVQRRCVESDAAARSDRFLGSPTLRVDGVDVDPGAGDRVDFGVKCRLYPAGEGLRGAPPDEWVLSACARPAIRRADWALMVALVLTGSPGAGKTAVLEALSDALSRRRHPSRDDRG